ncbi:MAG: sigma-54 dependent transcriptional regulator [Bacteroidetes bacterium]|nr:sigma-54 dependent transcriptional regulator [Bacteroidota bacterium]
MMKRGHILVIDDDDAVRDSLRGFLDERGYEVQTAADGNEGLKLFSRHRPDLVISDVRMKEMDGIEVLKAIKVMDKNLPVIIMTAFGDMDSVIEAMKLGAYDYLEKPFKTANAETLISRALETNRSGSGLIVTGPAEDNQRSVGRVIIGRSHGIIDVLKKIGQVATNKINVLIQGESGTGKELVSRIIHESGPTRDFPFIPVDVSALPETLLESELFGHVKGAFTGATRDRKGRFEVAGEGTIFLDEISEISLGLQSKLLRVLQEREFQKVGDDTPIPMKARVIAATNKNLDQVVREGGFRQDLFYRISVFTITVPPLRERKDDIPLLIAYFLKKINKDTGKNVTRVTEEVMMTLQEHEWVGNVRELENVLMQAVVLARGEVLGRESIIFRDRSVAAADSKPHELSLEATEMEHIRYVLEETNWDKSAAARLLNISRQTLYNKIKAYKLNRS